MRKNVQYIFVMLFLSLTMAGCYPDGPDYIDEYDIVYTNYDDQFSFAGKNTYAMPDSVVKITGAAATGDDIEFVDPIYAQIILEDIKENMALRGYTRVGKNDADFVLMASAIEVTNISYYYDYWGYYYGWYYPYGGYYYPYYPMVTSYTTGSLFMTLADNQNTNPSGKNKVVWVGVVNGLLEGSSTDFPSRINKSIDQAFAQSTYLRP